MASNTTQQRKQGGYSKAPRSDSPDRDFDPNLDATAMRAPSVALPTRIFRGVALLALLLAMFLAHEYSGTAPSRFSLGAPLLELIESIRFLSHPWSPAVLVEDGALPTAYAVCSAERAPDLTRPEEWDNKLASDAVYQGAVNGGLPRFACMFVENGKIAALGDEAMVRQKCSEVEGECDIRELGHGEIVLPGLHDAHGHVLEHGWALQAVDLVGSKSIAEIVKRIEAYVHSRPEILDDEDAWIEGLGWDQTLWTPPAFPTAADLKTPLLANRKIALRRVDVHAMWLSGRAMKDVESRGLPKETPGGLILRDAEGRPTGLLVDRAMELAIAAIPAWTNEERARYLDAAMTSLLSVGITSVGDAAVDLECLKFLRDTDAAGKLPLRIYAMLACPANEQRCAGSANAAGFPLIPGADSNGRLTVRTVKLFVDGALGSWGSAMWEPYLDKPDDRGLLLLPEADITPLIQYWVDQGWQVASHAIGDRANSLLLDAYVTLENTHELRLRIEHAQIVRLNDTQRFAALGVIPSMQPTHCTSDMNYVEKRIGTERAKGAYAWRSLSNAKAPLALGSDFPVERPDPLHGIYAAVTRLDAEGTSPAGKGGWFPEERLSRAQALHGFTLGAAYAQFEEHLTGSLEVGKRADFIILDTDILDEEVSTPAVLRRAKVKATVVDGQLAWSVSKGRISESV